MIDIASDWRQDFPPEKVVIPSTKALMEHVAVKFLALCQKTLIKRKSVSVILGGGRTPKKLNEKIVSFSSKYDIDWKRAFIFFSDERCIPMDHPDSNYRMIQETLLCHINIPKSNVHRIKGENGPEKAAILYEKSLKRFFGNVKIPEFDLALLGIGTDGHTASLFPESKSLYEQRKLVIPAGKGPEGYERVSLSYPLLNQSRNIWFVIAGEEKKNILTKLYYGDFEPVTCPAQGIRPKSGKLVYLTDQRSV